MTPTYYGNRGRTFEEFITYANKRYQQRGEAVIWKVPTAFLPIRNGKGKIISCKVEEKSCVDYLGRVGSWPIAIEAKHTASNTIRWDAVQEHQNQFLTDFMGDGEGLSLVLVSFNLERFFAVPWECWRVGRDAWKEAQRKGIKNADVIFVLDHDWETNGKASLKAEDLDPSWEIKMGGFIGLDYLRRYIDDEINYSEE